MGKIADFAAFYKKEIVLGAMIFVIASFCFGFGYLEGRNFNHAPVIIEKCGG